MSSKLKFIVTLCLGLLVMATISLTNKACATERPSGQYRGYKFKASVCPAYHKVKHQHNAKYSVRKFKYTTRW